MPLQHPNRAEAFPFLLLSWHSPTRLLLSARLPSSNRGRRALKYLQGVTAADSIPRSSERSPSRKGCLCRTLSGSPDPEPEDALRSTMSWGIYGIADRGAVPASLPPRV